MSLSATAAQTSAPEQFQISAHYDVMAQLDQDVHDDVPLSQSEAALALRLIGSVPRRVFLPCFGTGRHIPALLAAGVQEIVGVDLSPACVAKAKAAYGQDPRVRLEVGDLLTWPNQGSQDQFDAVILLGNSFGDCIDPETLAALTLAMVRPLRPGGSFLMDYIGQGYLDRCAGNVTSVWDAMLDGQPVKDCRTPSLDASGRVMTIKVVARSSGEEKSVRWSGAYQKRILSESEVATLFTDCGVTLRPVGPATTLNSSYYGSHGGELGMIARSTWWRGIKS